MSNRVNIDRGAHLEVMKCRIMKPREDSVLRGGKVIVADVTFTSSKA